LTQGWIANHIHVGKTGDTESPAEAAPSSAFDIGEDLKPIRDLESGVERLDP
jgi:hypothetical protein